MGLAPAPPKAGAAPRPGGVQAPPAWQSLLAVAEAALDEAGPILRRAFRAGVTADQKPDASPVTEADRAAEQAMRRVLAEHCPEHGVQGEEFGLERAGARLRWVLDPIDGTRAFLTGRPLFGTLLALLDDGVPVLGLIDQPVLRERWIGVAGAPTRFAGPFGGRPGTRPCAALSAAELSCTSPEMLGVHRAAWQRLADRVLRVSWGGDCYAYGLLALGQIDLVCECDLKPWDWAALVPVVEGAGGRITDWRGEKLRQGSDGRVLAAGDPALHAAILREGLLGEKIQGEAIQGEAILREAILREAILGEAILGGGALADG